MLDFIELVVGLSLNEVNEFETHIENLKLSEISIVVTVFDWFQALYEIIIVPELRFKLGLVLFLTVSGSLLASHNRRLLLQPSFSQQLVS